MVNKCIPRCEAVTAKVKYSPFGYVLGTTGQSGPAAVTSQKGYICVCVFRFLSKQMIRSRADGRHESCGPETPSHSRRLVQGNKTDHG